MAEAGSIYGGALRRSLGVAFLGKVRIRIKIKVKGGRTNASVPTRARAADRNVRPTRADVLAAFVVARANSRFLTGLSARFGMTSLF